MIDVWADRLLCRYGYSFGGGSVVGDFEGGFGAGEVRVGAGYCEGVAAGIGVGASGYGGQFLFGDLLGEFAARFEG